MTAPHTQSLLDHAAERWKNFERSPNRDLLRLAILRDLVSALHAEKSRFLSQGNRDSAASLRNIEERLDELRNCHPLDGTLSALISGKRKPEKRSRELPTGLFERLERGKIERYDRQWEKALAAEALAQGWEIWSLETEVEISRVDDWNQKLVSRLWPKGIVLFVETVEMHAMASPLPPLTPPHFWKGRWICVIDPLSEIRSEPGWKPVFSPKSRQTG